MEKVRWGILSTAQIGRTQVIPAISRSANGEVTAIASRSEEGRQAAEELGIEKFYPGYEDLLKDKEVDAVYIPLPNSLHKEWVLKAAAYGKHILCEKPAALNYEDLEEMIEACDHSEVLFMEAFMYQFHPQHKKVKELIASGAIGEVGLLRSSFSFFLGDKADNIRMNRELGGGALYDVGCYCLHAVRNISGAEPVQLYANARIDPDYQVDTGTAGTLVFKNGLQATFDCSFALTGRNSYEVVGSSGEIEVFSAFRPDVNENGRGQVRLTKADGETEDYFVDGDQYKEEVEQFAASILNGSPLAYSPNKMLANMKVLDACFRSIREGTSVTLDK